MTGSALQEAVEKEIEEALVKLTPVIREARRDILRRLYLSAQVSALESVAKEMCLWCRTDGVAAPTQFCLDEWEHELKPPTFVASFANCRAPKVQESLARLRAGSPEQAKEKHEG